MCGCTQAGRRQAAGAGVRVIVIVIAIVVARVCALGKGMRSVMVFGCSNWRRLVVGERGSREQDQHQLG